MTRSERDIGDESPRQNAPTGLQLFRARPDLAQQYSLRFSQAQRFRSEVTTAKSAVAELRDATNRRVTNLNEFMLESQDHLADSSSSATCGLAYLKIHDELSSQGVSEADIYDFFRLCVEINTRYRAPMVNELLRVRRLKAFIATEKYRESRIKDDLKTHINKIAEKPPSWFPASEMHRWKQFIAMHADFLTYVNPSTIFEYFSHDRIPTLDEFKKMTVYYGYTIADRYPDWMSNDEPPAREAVEAEFEEDTHNTEMTSEQLKYSIRQGEQLQDMAFGRSIKAVARVEQRRRETFPEPTSFYEAALSLGAEQDIVAYRLDPEVIKLTNSSDLKSARISSDRLREQIIQRISGGNFPTVFPEHIALYIEKMLRNGNIAGDASEVVTERMFELFDDTISSLQRGERIEYDRESPEKKQIRTLMYEIFPFIDTLPTEEIEYLRELLFDSIGSPLEMVIWEIASLSSIRLSSYDSATLGELKEKVQRFAVNWWRNNWQWAYEELTRSARDRFAIQPESAPRQPTSDALITSVSIPEEISAEPLEDIVPDAASQYPSFTPEDKIKEFEVLDVQVNAGNLYGWELLYITHPLDHANDLVALGGVSIDERVENLTRYIADERIPCTIKPSSVIAAFDWLVTVPEETEWIRIRRVVEGEEFKKLKRGGMRIHYKMDKDSKQILFFLYKKKAMSYK